MTKREGSRPTLSQGLAFLAISLCACNGTSLLIGSMDAGSAPAESGATPAESGGTPPEGGVTAEAGATPAESGSTLEEDSATAAEDGAMLAEAGADAAQGSGCGVRFTPTQQQPSVGNTPIRVVIGDLNADGKLDLVVASLASGVGVLLGNGDGTFGAQTLYSSVSSSSSVAIGDMNHDGKPDIVSTGRDEVVIFVGNGDGSFQAPVTVRGGASISTITITDVNGDQLPDIAMAEEPPKVLLGRADGTFNNLNPGDAGLPADSYFIGAGDFNGDGKSDLAQAEQFGNRVAVFLANANGTVQAPSLLDTGANSLPSSLATGDLNQDGKVDIAVTNGSSNSVGVFLGNGNGTFQPQVEYQVGAAPSMVQIADLDGDGKQDLVVVNVNSNSLSILLGHGDGTFDPQTLVDAGSGSAPRAIAVGDLNRDGRPDLASLNGGLGSVSIFLGRCDAVIAR